VLGQEIRLMNSGWKRFRSRNQRWK